MVLGEILKKLRQVDVLYHSLFTSVADTLAFELDNTLALYHFLMKRRSTLFGLQKDPLYLLGFWQSTG